MAIKMTKHTKENGKKVITIKVPEKDFEFVSAMLGAARFEAENDTDAWGASGFNIKVSDVEEEFDALKDE